MTLLSILLAAVGVLASMLAAVWFKGKYEQSQHETEISETKMQQYKALDEDREKLQKKTVVLDKKHRQEVQHENEHISDRNDFDNDWGDGL